MLSGQSKFLRHTQAQMTRNKRNMKFSSATHSDGFVGTELEVLPTERVAGLRMGNRKQRKRATVLLRGLDLASGDLPTPFLIWDGFESNSAACPMRNENQMPAQVSNRVDKRQLFPQDVFPKTSGLVWERHEPSFTHESIPNDPWSRIATPIRCASGISAAFGYGQESMLESCADSDDASVDGDTSSLAQTISLEGMHDTSDLMGHLNNATCNLTNAGPESEHEGIWSGDRALDLNNECQTEPSAANVVQYT